MTVQRTDSLPSEYEHLQVGVALYDPEMLAILDAYERLESLYGYSGEALRILSVDEHSANTYEDSDMQLHGGTGQGPTGDRSVTV